MSLLAWIILGLVAGFIASKLVNHSGQGLVLDFVLGVIGAVFGGWMFTSFGMAGVTGFNLYSLLVAVIGAAVLLMIYHGIARSSE
ncbi:GlsB/YeaQ/YmgE family stress response membrane protein [Chitinimonas naiadis]